VAVLVAVPNKERLKSRLFTSYLMSYGLLARRFVRHASRKLGLEGRLSSFEGLINRYNKEGRCMPGDVIYEYVDSLFMPIIEDTKQLAFGYKVDDKIEYYLRRYLKSNDLRGFVKYVLGNENYAELDAINMDNYWGVPIWFGYGFSICPVGGGTCASSTTSVCITSIKHNAGKSVCCTGTQITSWTKYFIMQDTVPYKTRYDSVPFGVGPQVPTSPGVFTLNGNFTAPSCFPTSGVTLDLDLSIYPSGVGSGTCASSCPTGTICWQELLYPCGSTGSSYNDVHPVFYYYVRLLAIPSSTYSVWVQYSTY
jgi:hypothetical protein